MQNRPNDWRLRLELGQALIALGRWDEAAEEFKSAINLRAGHNWIRGNWWTQGPFRASLTDPLPPDTKVDVSAAVAGKFTPTGDSAEALRWRLTNVAGPWVYFHTYYKNAEHVTAYALCFIYSAREQQVALSIGVDDMGRISMNGKQVYEYANPAHASAPGDGRALVTLKPGWNTLLGKVYNVLGGHTLYAELSDDPRDIAAARTASQQPNVTSSIKK